MMKLLIYLFLVILLPAFGHAQEYEYGKPEELRGLTRVWVDTYGDIEARNRIIERINKDLPRLSIVEDLHESEIRLQYKTESAQYLDVPIPVGRGIVWIDAHGTDRSRPRLVTNFQNHQTGRYEKAPVDKFAREFVKAYKKANGLR